MPDVGWFVALTGVTVLYAAWYEHRRDNRRDATLLGAIGMGVVAVGGAVAMD